MTIDNDGASIHWWWSLDYLITALKFFFCSLGRTVRWRWSGEHSWALTQILQLFTTTLATPASSTSHWPSNVKPTATCSQSQAQRQYQTSTNTQIPRRSCWQRQVPHRPWKVQSRHLSWGAFACWCFLACLWGSQADFKINVRSHLDVLISLHSYEAGGHLL